MDQQTRHRRSGSYTANLLGNIRSHLAGLQGYDVMAIKQCVNTEHLGALAVLVGEIFGWRATESGHRGKSHD